MATEKRFISTGDTVYIIALYTFYPGEKPQVVEANVAYRYRKQYYSYPVNNRGTFKFNNRNLGKTVFFTREEAEAELAKINGGSENAAD